MNKQILRKQMLNIRNEISDRQAKSTAICTHILDMNFREKQVGIYMPIYSEVDILPIVDHLSDGGIFLPTVHSDGSMNFRLCRDLTTLKPGYYPYILEPGSAAQPADHLDVLLIPGVAFSQSGMRLGYGKGYYDRFLQAHPHILKIGVCYTDQVTEISCFDPSDIPMDLLVTERGVLPCHGSS